MDGICSLAISDIVDAEDRTNVSKCCNDCACNEKWFKPECTNVGYESGKVSSSSSKDMRGELTLHKDYFDLDIPVCHLRAMPQEVEIWYRTMRFRRRAGRAKGFSTIP